LGLTKVLDLVSDNINPSLVRGIELKNIVLVSFPKHFARNGQDTRGFASSGWTMEEKVRELFLLDEFRDYELVRDKLTCFDDLNMRYNVIKSLRPELLHKREMFVIFLFLCSSFISYHRL
jgi:hypothetical protein